MSRKLGESIVIDGNVKVTVVEVRGDKVRIGITAPREVIVDREEIHHAKHRDKIDGDIKKDLAKASQVTTASENDSGL